MADGVNRGANALERIANILDRFEGILFSPQLDGKTGEFEGPSFAERLMDVLENPMQVVNNAAPESPKLDPTYAALAGNCFGFATALKEALDEPDQFKKAQKLRELAKAAEAMSNANKERAETQGYEHRISVVSDGTMDYPATLTPDGTGRYSVEQHACSLPDKTIPKSDWIKYWTCPDCHQHWAITNTEEFWKRTPKRGRQA